MIEFKILKRSKESRARLGILKTSYGEIETPALVPVATQAVIKTLTSEQVFQTKTRILIANTFHLHLKPGEGYIKTAGGLHKFMNWPKPLMTDSGGFQVFSLGFGHDLNVGKILGYFPGENKEAVIDKTAQPRRVKITPFGVHFQSPVDGQELFIGPKESIKIQEELGADIIFAFDECTAPLSSYEYAKKALVRTHKWAKICLDIHDSDPPSLPPSLKLRRSRKLRRARQAIFGIVQGSKFKDLRIEAAKFINSLGFNGFGIGGDLGETKEKMKKILSWVIPYLNESKPRHLLGIGHLEDIENIVKSGIDLFDCTVPTHYARRGIAFTSNGRLNLRQLRFLKDKNPLDKKCVCQACQSYKRNYITHLIKAGEVTGLSLLTIHNLHFFNSFVEKIRENIKKDRI